MMDKEKPVKNVCIVGCGDVGSQLAVLYSQKGLPVTGIVRSEAGNRRLEQRGVAAWRCDLSDPNIALPQFNQPTLIYYFVPPPDSGKEDTHCRMFLRLLEQQADQVTRIVAISTTGVYGDRHGELVTEEDEPRPQVDRAYRRYDMECQLRDWCEKHNVALIILRVGGIYGPGRLPLTRIQKQIPVLHEHLAPQTNRIHVEDLVNICEKAASASFDFRIYNVSDGQDSNMTEYFYTLADYFHLPRPPAVDWAEAEKTMSAGMLSYLRESRRVDNSRLLSELQVTLRYPDLRSGLKASESTC